MLAASLRYAKDISEPLEKSVWIESWRQSRELGVYELEYVSEGQAEVPEATLCVSYERYEEGGARRVD